MDKQQLNTNYDDEDSDRKAIDRNTLKREAESNTDAPDEDLKKETGHKESNKKTDRDELEGEV